MNKKYCKEYRNRKLITIDFSPPYLLVFPAGKSGQEISRESWGFELSRFPGNLCRDLGKFFYISEGFSGTDIYHSDIKNALGRPTANLNFLFLLSLLKICFKNSQNF